MAKCSRCGVAETSLYINGVPVCLDCDSKTPQPPDSPWLTESNPPTPPKKKVQRIEDSRAAESKVHIVEAKHR
jgi:hypothetical protein